MKRFFRFSIVALFVITAAIGAFLAGWDRGWSRGKSEWNAAIREWKEFPPFFRVYFVGDIGDEQLQSNTASEMLDAIIADVKANVLPHVWKDGESATMQKYLPNFSIVISGNALLHHEVDQRLKILRFEWPAEKAVALDVPAHWHSSQPGK